MPMLLAEILAPLRSGKKLLVNECSMCGYPCGYVMQDGQLCYDAGCHCTGRYDAEPATEDDVGRLLEMNPGKADWRFV